MKTEQEAKAGEGEYDYDRTPLSAITIRCYKTFSVGIFQWIPKAQRTVFSASSLKRSGVVYRIRGYMSDPQAVYDRADSIVNILNGEDTPVKQAWLMYFKKFRSEKVKEKP